MFSLETTGVMWTSSARDGGLGSLPWVKCHHYWLFQSGNSCQSSAACPALGWYPESMCAGWCKRGEEHPLTLRSCPVKLGREGTYTSQPRCILQMSVFSEAWQKETMVGIWAFSREMGLELDFKGIERIIIWTGIMYYWMNLEAAIHWLGLGDFYLLRMLEKNLL